MALAPWVVAADADALLTFLAEVLGAQEVGRTPGPEGRVGHAETVVGGTTVVVMDAREGWAPQPALMRVDVDDLAAVLERAAAAGATVVTPRTSLPFGLDVARLSDPWGNLWWLQQLVEQVDVDTLLARLDDPASAETMSAYEASLDRELRRRS